MINTNKVLGILARPENLKKSFLTVSYGTNKSGNYEVYNELVFTIVKTLLQNTKWLVWVCPNRNQTAMVQELNRRGVNSPKINETRKQFTLRTCGIGFESVIRVLEDYEEQNADFLIRQEVYFLFEDQDINPDLEGWEELEQFLHSINGKVIICKRFESSDLPVMFEGIVITDG